MPNKNDKRAYQWPQDKDEMWFSQRLDTFPNGTQLKAYSTKVFQDQIQSSLDRMVSSQSKVLKKWNCVIICVRTKIVFFTPVTMMGGYLLRILLVFAVACPASVTSFPSTLSPQDSYSRFLQSLAGQQQLGSTRPPVQETASYPAGSYEHALQAGNILFKITHFTVASWNVYLKRIHWL